jgi:hypothetical protein
VASKSSDKRTGNLDAKLLQVIDVKIVTSALKRYILECKNRRRLPGGIAKGRSGRTGYAKVRFVSNSAFCEEVNWV